MSAELRYTTGTPRPALLLGLELVPLSGVALRAGTTVFGDVLGRAHWFSLQRTGGGVSVQLPDAVALPLRLQLDYAVTYEYSSPWQLLHSLGLTAQLLP